jgi:hypothetical protein
MSEKVEFKYSIGQEVEHGNKDSKRKGTVAGLMIYRYGDTNDSPLYRDVLVSFDPENPNSRRERHWISENSLGFEED